MNLDSIGECHCRKCGKVAELVIYSYRRIHVAWVVCLNCRDTSALGYVKPN